MNRVITNELELRQALGASKGENPPKMSHAMLIKIINIVFIINFTIPASTSAHAFATVDARDFVWFEGLVSLFEICGGRWWIPYALPWSERPWSQFW